MEDYMAKNDYCLTKCPITLTQNIIAGKWKVIILYHLSQRTLRFNELQKLIPGISQNVLTKQLRELENDGLIHREIYKEIPPKVEYSLTDLGKDFVPVMDKMCEWGKKYINKMQNK
jgi:DNA-binding HxlR family transcriptional regulator